MAAADDPHAVLGVAPGATQDEIRSAFRAKARAHHPDARPDDPEAAEKFRRIREAYQKLRNADGQRRARTASSNPAPAKPRAPSSAGDAGFKDVFDRVFHKKREEARYGPHPFHRPRPDSATGRTGRMTVPFAAAIIGGDHVLEVDFADGSGPRRLRVSLPEGVEDEQPFRVEGKLVRASVRGHPFLRREGRHVLLDLPLSLTELSLGAKVLVPTVEGLVELVVPARSRPGQRLRLRGKGVGGEGDQLCVLSLAAPALDRAGVREALEALDRADDRSPRPWDPDGATTKPGSG